MSYLHWDAYSSARQKAEWLNVHEVLVTLKYIELGPKDNCALGVYLYQIAAPYSCISTSDDLQSRTLCNMTTHCREMGRVFETAVDVEFPLFQTRSEPSNAVRVL
jgi:hypothetical protein